MKHDDDVLRPSDFLSKETLALAEELYRRLPSKLTLDKRGSASLWRGVFTDLDSRSRREYPVMVSDSGDQPWVTLLSETELPATGRGLLVYRVSPSDGRRYIGRARGSREGLRDADTPGHYYTEFDLIEDLRR